MSSASLSWRTHTRTWRWTRTESSGRRRSTRSGRGSRGWGTSGSPNRGDEPHVVWFARRGDGPVVRLPLPTAPDDPEDAAKEAAVAVSRIRHIRRSGVAGTCSVEIHGEGQGYIDLLVAQDANVTEAAVEAARARS